MQLKGSERSLFTVATVLDGRDSPGILGLVPVTSWLGQNIYIATNVSNLPWLRLTYYTYPRSEITYIPHSSTRNNTKELDFDDVTL